MTPLTVFVSLHSCVGHKREDADRKLTNRMLQEMRVLGEINPGPVNESENTTIKHKNANAAFVIISSDQDYRHMFELARSQGFLVYCLHQASNPRWQQVQYLC